MKNTLLFLTGVLVSSCGLVSKYQSVQHSGYARMLTRADKEQINRSGEITKDIELGNPTENIQKIGVIIGTRKDYTASGQLTSIKTFDENGKLIKEERY